jgi:hypothetical protein
MSIRANNTHIIFNDATTQATGDIITRVISTGTGEPMIASVSAGLVTLKTLFYSDDTANATHYMLNGAAPAPVGGVGE